MFATYSIRTGLRRLEFEHSLTDGGSTETTHVTVEFVVPARLTPGQAAQIHLGIRNGVQRILKGTPKLVDCVGAERGELLYQLTGFVP